MPFIKGDLKNVTTSPDLVKEVWVRAPSIRTSGATVITTTQQFIPVQNGVFEVQLEIGDAVLGIVSGDLNVDTIPLYVTANAVTLAECMTAEALTHSDPSLIEKLVADAAEISSQVALVNDQVKTVEAVAAKTSESERAATNAATAAAESAAAAKTFDPNRYAEIFSGKNLYNYSSDEVNFFLTTTGQPTALNNYRTSDFIPVTPGQAYTVNFARSYAFFDAAKAFIPGTYINQTQGAATVTPPATAAYIRFAYAVSSLTVPSMVQMERGSQATDYEAYRRVLDPSVQLAGGGAPITVTRSGSELSIKSDLGGKPIIQSVSLTSGQNGLFDFKTVVYAGALIHTTPDDVAPLRTQQGTVGSNHGLALMASFVSGKHDKTVADVGSVWTDGASEFVILHVDATGRLFVGKKYSVVNGANVAPNSTPAADLTHVSGATNTDSLLKVNAVVTAQMAPWIQRLRQVVELDGKPLADGDSTGNSLVVRESYEIHDYGAVYESVKANPGKLYTSAYQRAAVGVETEWRFNPGGKTKYHASIWEISPTTLGNSGFMQAVVLTGATTRYLPGVGVINGLDFDKGAPLASLTTSAYVKQADLLDGKTPPSVLVDMAPDIAMAIALSPWAGASESKTRLASTPANLWDLRNTKKIYPNVTGSVASGWGRLEVQGIRAFLSLAEAQAVVADADPINAWVTLDHMAS